MIRSTTLFIILAALVSTALAQKLTPDRQADLDGHYAGIMQKQLNFLKRAPQAPGTQQAIAQQNDAINAFRKRWVNTPYRANFEKGLNDELTKPAPRVDNPPIFSPPQQPVTIPSVLKLPLFIVAVWFCRKLWKAKPASAEPVLVDYNNLKVSLNPQEQKQYSEANRDHDAAVAKLDGEIQKVAAQLEQLKAKAAALAGRGSAMSGSLVSDAVAQLNHDAPDYQASIAALEADEPATLAPWSNGVWEDFAREPKQFLPYKVRIGEHVETGTFPDETGVKAPYLVDLLSSEGPIIVQCDAASKQAARSIIQNIVLRAALASSADVRFSLLDSSGFGFPFAAALPHVRPSIGEPTDQLPAIVSDIRRINQKVVGMRESFASLTADERSGEKFEVVAVLDYPTAYQRQIGVHENLALIAQSGPHAGCHLILEWNGTPGEADLARFPNAQVINARNNDGSPHFDAVPPPATIQKLLSASVAAKPKTSVADWNKQIRPTAFFAESSARKMETPMGERLRFWFGDDQNRTCAHAMIAGQSGSGKSVLLHVLITGLAARYSPAELRFILVDGKTGVEFKAYEGLPHADVACLNTSPAVARSVLADVVAEMDARYNKFPQGVANLTEYREAGHAMPRILMIVDEFQQLLEGDPDRGAEMLRRVLEKGRAAGIHLVLGSQMFEVSGFPSAAMSQVHLRASLSVSEDYVRNISAFSRQGRELIAGLSEKGQVVINDDGGKDGHNSRGTVAFFEPALRPKVITEISEQARAAVGSAAGPVVLNGSDAAVLSENPFVMAWKQQPPDTETLQNIARKPARDGGFGLTAWSKADRAIPLWCGRKFDVYGHLVAPLRRASGNNLFALGSKSAVRLLMLANALASLRAMRRLDDCEILLLDGVGDEQPGAGVLATALDFLRAAGTRAERAVPETAIPALERFAAAPRSANVEAFRLLILSEPERFPELESPQGYGPPPAGPSRLFKDLLKTGPVQGTHTIVTAGNLAALTSVVGRDLNLFQHRIVQQTNDDESMNLFSSTVGTTIEAQTGHAMGALYVDTLQGWREGQFFKCYAASRDIHGDQSAAGFTAALRGIYGAL